MRNSCFFFSFFISCQRTFFFVVVVVCLFPLWLQWKTFDSSILVSLLKAITFFFFLHDVKEDLTLLSLLHSVSSFSLSCG